MSDDPSVEFQDAVLTALKDDARVASVYGAAVYDRPPAGHGYPYIAIGPSDFDIDPTDGNCPKFSRETIQIDAYHRDDGRTWQAKAGARAIAGALEGAALDLTTNAASGIAIERARVFRVAGDVQTTRVVVQVTAVLEDRR